MRQRFLALVVLCAFRVAAGGEPEDRVRRGNALLREGKAEEALGLYREAQVDRPGGPVLPHNAGIALFRLGRLEEAIEEFDRARAAGRDAGSEYQRGCALYRLGRLEESLEAFRDAIRLDPADLDAKFNYELVKKKLEEQQKQEKQEDEREEKKQEQPQQDKGEAPEEKKKPEPKPSEAKEIPPEEAERLLDKLAREEKEYRARKLREARLGAIPVERDW